MDKDLRVRAAATGICRGCGARFTVAYTNVNGRNETPSLIHPEPACADFLKRDLIDFLVWNRLGDA